MLYDVPVLINHKELLVGKEILVYSKPDDIIGKAVAIPKAFALQRTATVPAGSVAGAEAKAKEQTVPK